MQFAPWKVHFALFGGGVAGDGDTMVKGMRKEIKIRNKIWKEEKWRKVR